MVPFPGQAAGPKARRAAWRASARDDTGNQRVRVLVVRSLGSRHRSDVSEVLAGRRVARRGVVEVPSPKETVTP